MIGRSESCEFARRLPPPPPCHSDVRDDAVRGLRGGHRRGGHRDAPAPVKKRRPALRRLLLHPLPRPRRASDFAVFRLGIVLFGYAIRCSADTLIQVSVAHHLAEFRACQVIEGLFFQVVQVVLVAVGVNGLEVVFLFLDDLFFDGAGTGRKPTGPFAALFFAVFQALCFGTRGNSSSVASPACAKQFPRGLA